VSRHRRQTKNQHRNSDNESYRKALGHTQRSGISRNENFHVATTHVAIFPTLVRRNRQTQETVSESDNGLISLKENQKPNRNFEIRDLANKTVEYCIQRLKTMDMDAMSVRRFFQYLAEVCDDVTNDR